MSVFEDIDVSKAEDNPEDQLTPELLQLYIDFKKTKEKRMAEVLNRLKQSFQRQITIKNYILNKMRTINESSKINEATLLQQISELEDVIVKKKLERDGKLEQARCRKEQKKINQKKQKELEKNQLSSSQTKEDKEKMAQKHANLIAQLHYIDGKMMEVKKGNEELSQEKEMLIISREVARGKNQILLERKQVLEEEVNELKSKMDVDDQCDNSLAQLDRGPLHSNILPADNAPESLFNEVSSPMEVENEIYSKNKEEYLKLKKEVEIIKIEYQQLEEEMTKLKSGELKFQREAEENINFKESSSLEVMTDLIAAIDIIEDNLNKAKTSNQLSVVDLKDLVKKNHLLEEVNKLDDLLKTRYYLPFKLSKQEANLVIDVELAHEVLKKQVKINQTLKEQIASLQLKNK